MINAKQFYSAYIQEVKEEKVDRFSRRYFDIYKSDEPAFTELVNYTLIPNAIYAIEPEMTVQHEYYRVDTIGWKAKYKDIQDEAKKVGLNPHLWDLMIAVEHENSKKDWLDEVIKLINIRCPLKVVVSYNNCDCRGSEEIEKLDFAAKCMNMVESFNKSKGEEYLIIIGNSAPKNKYSKTYDKFGYSGYLYDWESECFQKI